MGERKAATINNPALQAVDFIISVICLAGAAFCLWAFWSDLNRSLFKLNETPIGTVTWKYKAAQRRFANRVLWDRLRKDSSVYNGDLIRTEDLSEATIVFTGAEKSIVNLEENSLIQIFFENDAARIRPGTGSIGINAGSGGMVLIVNDKEITAAEGSGLRLAAGSEEGLNILVNEGTVTYAGENGLVEAAAGEVINFAAPKVSPAGIAPAADERPSLPVPKTAVFAPRQDAAFLSSGAAVPVEFSFNPINYNGEITRLEISPSRNFSRGLVSRDLESHRGTVELGPGPWWWRAYPARSGSSPNGTPANSAEKKAAAGKITILRISSPSLLSPQDGQTLYFTVGMQSNIRFRWKTEARDLEAAEYSFEVADNPAFTNPRISRQTENNGAAASQLEAGTWYWRVTPFYSGGVSGMVSQVSSFKVEQRAAPLPPVPVSPANKVTAPGENVYLAWKGEDQSWTVTISANQDLSNPVIVQHIETSYFVQKEKLGNGTWYWSVRGDSAQSAASPVSTFIVGNARPAAAPSRPAAAEAPAALVETPETPAAAKTEPAAGTLLTQPPAVEEKPAALEEPVPLSAPKGLRPAPNYTFTPNHNNRSITFSWNPLAGAQSYQFSLSAPDGTVLFSQNLTSPSFTFDELSVLNRGNFIWQVEGVDKRGIPGAAASRGFTVNIPEIKKQELDAAGILYGN